MDDNAACVDLCEENGFAGPAAALRAVASGRARFYLVRSLLPPEEAEFYGFEPNDVAAGVRKVFLDPDAAWLRARAQTVRALRSYVPCVEYAMNPSDRSDEDYVREVGAILRVEYRLSTEPGERAFPGSASDDQSWCISKLFSFPLFDVVAFGETSASPPDAASDPLPPDGTRRT